MRRKDYELPRSVVGWVYNHARRNYWRVARWYELDDLIHDGLLCAYKCREHYGVPGVDIDEPHFMSLVKSTFYNHIGDLLRRNRDIADGPKIAELVRATETEQQALDRLLEPTEPLAEYALLITELPEYLRRVVLMYLNDDKALEELRRRARVLIGTGEETLSQRLSRLCGFPAEKDFETELRVFLWERKMEI